VEYSRAGIAGVVGAVDVMHGRQWQWLPTENNALLA